MMNDESLPPDLSRIERHIGSLMQFEPQAEYGCRVIGAMRGEMQRERSAANWKFALGLAAGAFLWLHMSFYMATVTDFHFRDSPAMAIHSLGPKPRAVFPDWSN
jgi:hypothetical protein